MARGFRFVMGGALGDWPQIETSEGKLVARTFGPGAEDAARLFAAAPDMLAALQAFLRAPSIGSSGPGSITIEVQSFNLKDARAAIARATGREG